MFYNHWLNISVSALGYNFPRFQHKVPGNSEDTTTHPTAWHGVSLWVYCDVAHSAVSGMNNIEPVMAPLLTSRWGFIRLAAQLSSPQSDDTHTAQLIGAAVSSSQNTSTASLCALTSYLTDNWLRFIKKINIQSTLSERRSWIVNIVGPGKEVQSCWLVHCPKSTEVESRCKYLIFDLVFVWTLSSQL